MPLHLVFYLEMKVEVEVGVHDIRSRFTVYILFSIRRTERESLKSGTITHISVLIIRIAKAASWWWIPRWSSVASLKAYLCSTLNATPKWDILTTNSNYHTRFKVFSYFHTALYLKISKILKTFSLNIIPTN